MLTEFYFSNRTKLPHMAETAAEQDQPLTPAGRMFLQPQINQIIYCAITVDFPFDLDAFMAELRTSLMVQHPRFCSLVVRNSYGREYWRRAEVDVERHVIVHRRKFTDDPSVSDTDAVNEFIADLTVSSPLPMDKPLWEIHMLLEQKTAVFRMHHALGDGISMMSLLLSCCRSVEDPSRTPDLNGGGGASTVVRRRLWCRVWNLVMCLLYSLIYAVEFMARSLWLRDRTTAISGGAGVELWPRRLASARFRLDDMKIVKGTVAGATINDVLIGVISCGLSRYLDIRSTKALPEGLRITGLAMVNLRPPSQLQDLSKMINSSSGTRWGNKFGMLLLPVYYHKCGDGSNPIQFVKRAKAMTDEKKVSLEAPFTYKAGHIILSLFGAKFASLLNYRIICNTTFTVSNIVGPREKILLTNNPVNSIRATSSSLAHAITMHMLSYDGIAELQILVAKDVIPDPKVLAKLFEEALLEMKEAAKG